MLPNLEVAMGSFARPTSTGDYTVSGLSFQPKAIKLFGCSRASVGDQANSRLMIGYAANDGTQAWIGESLDDGSAYYTVCLSSNDAVYASPQNVGGSYNFEAYAQFVQMTSDGFTITFSIVDGNSPLIYYVAFGGDAITNATVGQFNPRTTTGNQNVTVGFAPDVLDTFSSGAEIGGASQYIQMATAQASVDSNGGITTGSSIAVASDYTTAPSNNRRNLRSAFVHQLSPTADILNKNGSFAGTAGLGFRVSHTTVSADISTVSYLALKGVTGRAQAIIQPTSGTLPVAGNITNIPFTPKFLMVQGVERQAGPGVNPNLRHLRGYATSESNQVSIFQGSTDNVTPPVNREDLNTTYFIRNLNETSTGVTVKSQHYLTGLTSTGFTGFWDTIDATPRTQNYFALAAKPVYLGALFLGKGAKYQFITKTWDFNNGADGWTTSGYDATYGNGGTGGFKATCTSVGKGCSTSFTTTWTGTFEDLGVPAGATVEWVVCGGVANVLTGVDSRGDGTTSRISKFDLNDSGGGLLQRILSSTDVTSGWKRYGQLTEDGLTFLNLPSNTSIQLVVAGTASVSSGSIGAGTIEADNFSVTIKYRW